MIEIMIFHSVLNSMLTKLLEQLTKTYVVFPGAVPVTCCSPLLVMDENKHASYYVWRNVNLASGWNPAGFSLLFGFLSVSWTMTDCDATLAHIAENIQDPQIKTHQAIIIALGFTYVTWWPFNILLVFY